MLKFFLFFLILEFIVSRMKLRSFYSYKCLDKDRVKKFCTMEYVPVCGWFKSYINCFVYPCAMNFGNICTACLNKDIDYVTMGKCPSKFNDTILK